MLENDPDAVELTVEVSRFHENSYMLRGETKSTLVQLIQITIPDEVLSEDYEGKVVARVKPIDSSPDWLCRYLCEVYE